MLFCPDFWIVVVSAEPFWGRRGPAAAAGGGGWRSVARSADDGVIRDRHHDDHPTRQLLLFGI